MSVKKAEESLDPEVKIQSAIGNTENFIIRNGRKLIIALVVVFVVVGGFYGYKFWVEKLGEKAAAMMFRAEQHLAADSLQLALDGDVNQMIFEAEQHLAADSLQLALDGDENHVGFLQVIDKYGSTPQGNLARLYAGICYMRLGQFEQALAQLKKYDAPKSIPGAILKAQCLGLQGDACVELQNYKEAVSFYKKAVEVSENSLTAPFYMKKLGLVYEKQGDNAKALDVYKDIQASYGSSMEARDIQKFIGRLEQL